MKIFSKLLDLFLRIRYGKPEPVTHQGEKLDMVQYPEGGGIETYHQGSKFPFPGFTSLAQLEGLGRWKRLIPLLADFLQKQVKPYMPDDPSKYSKPVRELYRVGTLLAERHHHFWPKRTFRQLRDIACVILERDDGYRFPFQDAFSTLDLDQIKMNEQETYWACYKPYDFGGIENKPVMDKIREDRIDYEMDKAREFEIKIQEGLEKNHLREEQVGKIIREILPDLEAVLEKHEVKPNLDSATEEQVDVKIRIKLK